MFGAGVSGRALGKAITPCETFKETIILRMGRTSLKISAPIAATLIAAHGLLAQVAGDTGLAEMRERWRAEPADPAAAAAYACANLDIARRADGGEALAEAGKALGGWIESPDPPPAVRLARALYHSRCHQFAPALRDLDAVLRSDSGNGSALAAKASLLIAQGRFPEAKETSARLELAGHAVEARALEAEIWGLTGHLATFHDLLAEALADSAPLPAATRAWMLGALADMAARRGDRDGAVGHLRLALELTPGDAVLLAALADRLIEGGRFAEAAELVDPYTGHDGLLLRSMIAETKGARPAADNPRARSLAARLEAARGTHPHLREEAMVALYLLGNPRRALDLALENWRTQRSPDDLRLLFEAALSAGDPGAAAEAVAWVREVKMEGKRLAELAARLAPAKPELESIDLAGGGTVQFFAKHRAAAERLVSWLPAAIERGERRDPLRAAADAEADSLRQIARFLGLEKAGEVAGKVFAEGLPLFFEASSFPDPRYLQLWDRAELAAFLKAGGQLPGLSFDLQTNEFRRTLRLASPTPAQRRGQPMPASPIYLSGGGDGLDQQAKDGASALIEARWRSRCLHAGQLLHECAEAMLVREWRLEGKGVRWFAEGAANIAAAHALRELAGDDAAAVFLAAYDPARFPNTVDDASLDRWAAADAGGAGPAERAANEARYAAATRRAAAVLQRCGGDSFAPLLEGRGGGEPMSGDELRAKIAALPEPGDD